MNKNIKKRINTIRKSKVTEVVLKTIATAGILTIAMAVPNAVSLLGMVGPRNRSFRVKKALKRLIEEGYVVMSKKEGDRYLSLTSKGQKLSARISMGNLTVKRPGTWDGKWHVLIFDIPENKKAVRDKIRQTLILIGFVRLQDSVWVYPYYCEDFITLLKVDFKIGKELLYLIVDSLEGDTSLKKYFELE